VNVLTVTAEEGGRYVSMANRLNRSVGGLYVPEVLRKAE